MLEINKMLLTFLTEKSYVMLKELCLNQEDVINHIYTSLSAEEKLNDSPKTDEHIIIKKEMDRLWGLIDNLSQKQGEELDLMTDLFPKVCAIVNKSLNL